MMKSLGPLLLLSMLGCGGGPDDEPGQDGEVALRFAAMVGEHPWRCEDTYDGVGAPPVRVNPVDLRFFVHDLRLVSSDGEEVPAPLLVDPPWQSVDVALVDLAGMGGQCAPSSPERRDLVRIAADPDRDWAGVRFTLGVPPAHNHLHTEDATPPLDEVGLWWGWRYGYKYLAFELAAPDDHRWFFHLGAADCDGNEQTGYACARDNLVRVALDGIDPVGGAVLLDLKLLLDGSDVGGTDGCQTGPGDADCVPLFARLGLDFTGEEEDLSPQVVFRGEVTGTE